MSAPIVVIGAGRIGLGLRRQDPQRFALIDRRSGWAQLEGGAGAPVLVAVRNDDLPAVLERVPASRREDLVFIQNGMLRPWLREAGLEQATRGLLFMAAATRESSLEPGGTSPFWGPRAQALVEAFLAAGLPAERVDAEAFAAVELEKLIWNCAFGLCCEALDASVGEIVARERETLRGLVAELLALGGPALGLELELEPLVERLCAYSRSIADYQGAVKEWRWRNGWFVELAERSGSPAPIHARLLASRG